MFRPPRADFSKYKVNFHYLSSLVLFGRPDFKVIGAERPASVMFTYTLPQTIIPHMKESNAKFFASISVKVGISVEKYFMFNY